jgi:hypothetical protein
MYRAYRYTKRRHPVQGEERWMLYGDRGYGIAHSRAKEAIGRALRSGGTDEHAREEDSGVSARLDASGAGRGVLAVRYRRLRRAT